MENLSSNPWLSRLAKLCVLATLVLILVGGMVTTSGAGMAVATWPTIHGQLNPSGWIHDHAVRLEHSHRLLAISIGVFIGFLCAWVWKCFWALGVAALVSGLGYALARVLFLDGNLAMHLRIWPAAVAFVIFLFIRHRVIDAKTTSNQRFALVLFSCVCIQAVMGGYRVTLETDGNNAVREAEVLVAKANAAPLQEAATLRKAADELGVKANALYPIATNLRVLHGCFAQLFLALLVIFAARLSPVWWEISQRPSIEAAPKIRRMAMVALCIYFAQLSCAAYLRHRGLGLVIPTWPGIGQGGGFLPAGWNHAIAIHFLHSRVLPILLTGHILGIAIVTARRASHEPRLTRLSWGLLALVLVQFFLGVMVIWKFRQPHITNTHVITGALICATAALLVTRAGRLSHFRWS